MVNLKDVMGVTVPFPGAVAAGGAEPFTYQFMTEVTPLDKYEYKIRAEEIKTLISQKKYAEAAKIADTIDWTRVKSVMMLCTVSDVYKMNRRFEDAKLLLEMANERHPSGRMIIYSLCDLSIRMGDVVHAIEYYKDFVQIAPNDTGRYVLQYKLYEAQDVGLEERIAVLEELKKKDYREKWAYELAYLYHRVGLATKCVEECDELILWFGEGKYVMKAMELKTLHQPLSPSQQKKFDAYMMRRQGLKVPEELQENSSEKSTRKKAASEGQEMDIQVKTMDVGKYNTINLQKELAASMKELMQEGKTAATAVAPAPSRTPQQQVYAEPAYQEPEYTGQVYQEPAGQSSETEYAGQNVGASYVAEPAEEYSAAEYSAAEEMHPVQDETAGQAVPHEQTDYENYLSQEYDGQISMVVPEEHPVEKQITGQMNIEDIMREWEKMKRENEEKRRQELRQRVQEQTGALFRDFDETSRKGVLERLQKEERIPVDRRERYTGGVISAHTKIWAAEEVQNAMKAAAAAGSAEKAREAAEMSAAVNTQETAEPHAASNVQESAEPQIASNVQEPANPQAETMSQETAGTQDAPEAVSVAAKGAVVLEDPAGTSGAAEKTVQEAERSAGEPVMKSQGMAERADGKAETGDSVPEAAAVSAPAVSAEAVSAEAAPEPGVSAVAEAVPENAPEASVETAGSERENFTGQRKVSRAMENVSVAQPAEALAEKASSGKQRNERKEVQAAGPKEEEAKASEKKKAERTLGERSLSSAEKRLFASFVPTKGAMKRLVSALDQISLAAYTGNLIITGEPGSDTLELAKNVVKDLKAKEPDFSGRIAKVTGSALNGSKRPPAELVEKLAGGALMIEKAGDISRECADKLLKALNQERWGILVILMDTKRRIRKLLEENPELDSYFNARFDVEALDNSTLVAYGCQYARMQEYAIDELGRLALHTRIEDMQTSDHIVTVKDVREIVDEAIDHAERKTPKHFMDVLLSRRYDDNDMIILHEADFI